MILSLDNNNLTEFAHAAVDFSRTYPGAIPRLLATEIELLNPNTNFFFKEGGKARYFVYKLGNKIVGKIAAFINPKLTENGLQIGTVGLFDCIENASIAHELIHKAVEWLRENHCKTILGPMDFSIWHSYRFMTQGFGSRGFYGEPRNPEYYPVFFLNYGFSVRTTWESQVLDRHGMNAFVGEYKPQLDLSIELGYTFEVLKKANKDELMRFTYQTIIESYKYFPVFNPISEADFLHHFRRMPDILDTDCSQFVRNPNGMFVGFLLAPKDLYRPLVAMNGSTNFWAKMRYLWYRNQTNMANIAQGGTVPYFIREAAILGKKHQNLPISLAGVTICKALKNILAFKKYEQTIISLMREGAAIKNHAFDIATEKRTYALYELKP